MEKSLRAPNVSVTLLFTTCTVLNISEQCFSSLPSVSISLKYLPSNMIKGVYEKVLTCVNDFSSSLLCDLRAEFLIPGEPENSFHF